MTNDVIEWENRPEGATHYRKIIGGGYWIKVEDGIVYYWRDDDYCWQISVDYKFCKFKIEDCIPVPTESKNKYPPIGSVGYLTHITRMWYTRFKCKVITHEPLIVKCLDSAYSTEGDLLIVDEPFRFEDIETIKEKEIKAIEEIINESRSKREAAEALYNAGLRIQKDEQTL